MILLIDNYDSFSYNLYQAIGEYNSDIRVIKNDEMTVAEIDALSPTHIILSPGPKRPDDAGVCLEVIETLHKKYPMLGVCLGHQSICQSFGTPITYAKEIMHGKQSEILLKDSQLFKGLGEKVKVARYHSLAATKDLIADELIVTGTTEDGEIMAVEHTKHPIFGVQFHPESILTPDGSIMIKNFLEV